MLRKMRAFWDEVSAERRSRVREQVAAARQRQQEVNSYWDRHKKIVKERWRTRPFGRGSVTVADIPEVAEQWHPANPGSPDQVLATYQGRAGEESPYRWRCPLNLGHASWAAWPKDRIQAGTGCPQCRHLISLADVPVLVEQYRGTKLPKEVSLASHEAVDWECRTWAVDPRTGRWYKVTHRFTAIVKERTLQGNGCLVCAGYVVDDSNSLLTWFPEIAAELDDDSLDPATLPTSRHNATRRAGGTAQEKYEKLPWRCRHGHRWSATIANRVASGGCPDCSPSGLSKEQIRLTAELATLIRLIPPNRPDPRLPEGVPNFGSHRIPIPPELRPEGFRRGQIEVDAVFELDNHLIGLEYDGSFYHSVKHRDRRAFTVAKDRILISLGYLPVHVRLGHVPDLDSPGAIIVKLDERATAYQAAKEVGLALEEKLHRRIPGLMAYIRDGHAKATDLAERYINCVWGVKRQRLSRRKSEGVPRKVRDLRATPPAPGSLLEPIGPPYRSPQNERIILRDYNCACGGEARGLVQAEVTRGNTRSCGCLANSARRQGRVKVPRITTQEARRWAAKQGIAVSNNGRVPAPVLASYLLKSANRIDLPVDEFGVLIESPVRDWATKEGMPLLARGRLPERVWIAYALAHGASLDGRKRDQ